MRSLTVLLLLFFVCACAPVINFNDCGDKACTVGETNYSCPKDCPPDPVCGDKVCSPSEQHSCDKDCGISNDVCGDGNCTASEQSYCTTDCGALKPACGDSHCTDKELNSGSCPHDCGGSTIEFCGNRVSVSTEAVKLNVPVLSLSCRPQSWSFVGTMIATFFGVDQDQCDFTEFRAGSVATPCCQDYTCEENACNAPGKPEDIDNALREVLDLYGTQLDRNLEESELQIELSNGRPVIIGLDDTDYEGRYAIISGFDGQVDGYSSTYHIIDPYYGELDAEFHSLFYGYGTGSNFPRWTRTWYRLGREADGCNLYFDTACGCD